MDADTPDQLALLVTRWYRPSRSAAKAVALPDGTPARVARLCRIAQAHRAAFKSDDTILCLPPMPIRGQPEWHILFSGEGDDPAFWCYRAGYGDNLYACAGHAPASWVLWGPLDECVYVMALRVLLENLGRARSVMACNYGHVAFADAPALHHYFETTCRRHLEKDCYGGESNYFANDALAARLERVGGVWLLQIAALTPAVWSDVTGALRRDGIRLGQ